ncbi:MAG: hypothetical protein JXB15_09310 [Anaerolineales bacterium]|nr:hypothetical protein [Anaerolineales bacterium]
MKYDPQKHHRRSIRLKGYDYTQPGAYFVTLVAAQRAEIFGAVTDGAARLSPLGEIARYEWLRSAEMRREIRLFEDELVIMPNHIHGIVWMVGLGDDQGARGAPLRGNDDAVGADGIRPGYANGIRLMDGAPDGDQGARGAPLRTPDDAVGADGVRPGYANGIRPTDDAPDGDQGARGAPLRLPRSLSSIIAGFKSAVTSRAQRELGMSGIWQRNYFEHIIRNEAELQEIRAYILHNPACWQQDQLHPAAPPNPFNQDKHHV